MIGNDNVCIVDFISYMLLLDLKRTKTDDSINSQRPIASALMFAVDQLIIVLWRHPNTYCGRLPLERF